MTESQQNPARIPESRRAFLRNTAIGMTAASFAELLRPTPGTLASPAGGSAPIEEIRDSNTLIRIGVFDPAFHDLSLEQMIEIIKEIKIEAVELGSGNEPGNPHCDREELLADPSKRRAYAAACGQCLCACGRTAELLSFLRVRDRQLGGLMATRLRTLPLEQATNDHRFRAVAFRR